MTPAQRDQLAIPVVVMYWVMLVAGLVVCAAQRIDDFASIMPIWIGAVGGTLLGQALAMRDYRPWIAVTAIAVVTAGCIELVPLASSGRELWLAFVPAALCGFWSLGDRSALAACWFPAVIWMLSILDRSDATLAADGIGVVLLAGLAVLFVALLRVRESRRVALWRSVAAVPLAPPASVELLRTPPHRELARAGWGLSVSAITIAITAWVAPALWQIEPLDARDRSRIAGHTPSHRLPCCPVAELESESSRVKEYLDLGRGHDRHITRLLDRSGCRVCTGVASADAAFTRDGLRRHRITPEPFAPGTARYVDEPAGTGPGAVEPSVESAPPPVESAGSPGYEPATPTASPAAEPVPLARVQATIEPAPAAEPAAAEPVATGEPSIEPSTRPAPADGAARADGAPPGAVQRARSMPVGPSVVHWLLVLASAGLIFQLVSLALRPLRRLITLRHLRRPFWNETVAQRVSNSWQLALIGLRDAGWMSGVSEAPHELARRVSVDGIDRCATILERARHGIGIDAEDLAEMDASADTAYRAARRDVSRFARLIGWLRWPLT